MIPMGTSRHHAQRLPPPSRLAKEGVAEEADPGQAVGSEGVPVRGIDVEDSHPDDEEHDAHLDGHHGGVEVRALLDADDEDPGDEGGDDDPGQVEEGPRAHKMA